MGLERIGVRSFFLASICIATALSVMAEAMMATTERKTQSWAGVTTARGQGVSMNMCARNCRREAEGAARPGQRSQQPRGGASV
jgi:hypothetical protein